MNEVLINHMYSGNYLETGNLGHEVINLFKCDNGNHYIYAMPAGDYDTKSHNNSIKKVILVRNIDQYKTEVLGICDVEEEIFRSQVDEPDKYKMLPSVNDLVNNDFMNTKKENGTEKDKNTIKRIENYKKVHMQQRKYIDNNAVTYGNVKLYDFYNENNTQNLGQSIYITFKVTNFKMPKESIYLCDKRYENKENDPHFYILKNRARMCGASVATYESLDDEGIKKLINSPFWEEKDNSLKVDIERKSTKTASILNIIKKVDDEIIYSNWIVYYLKNDKKILCKFIKHFIPDVKATFENIEIARETKNNIDIYYEDTNNIFVFENKIKSSINGNKMKNGITEEEKEYSQLKKYYDYAEEKSKESKTKKNTRYFLLLPDYAYKYTTKLNRYAEFDKYEIIRYSQLLDFFKSCKTKLPYYDEFIKAIEYHSGEYHNDLYLEMMERLQTVISLRKNIYNTLKQYLLFFMNNFKTHN